MAESAEQIARKAIDCINAHDLGAYGELHSDDFELTDTATGETFRGPDGSRKNMQGWFTPFPDANVEIVNLVAGDDWVAIEAVGRGTHTGPLATPGGDVPPTGKSITLPFCSTIRISDGKIVAGRDYYNLAAVMMQLGLMPEPATA
jgi:steroid delta-isomerase-like uncharacterized protein